MTTTFILHGGNTGEESPANDLFFKHFTDLVDKPTVKIVMCYWARPKDRWDGLLARDSAKVKKQTDKEVVFCVPQDPNELFARLPSSDVVYIAGGTAELINPFIKDFDLLSKLLDGKVFFGSSMGAFIASRHYVLSYDSADISKVCDGLGMLPVMTLCHWNAEDRKQQKINLLRQKDPELPILALGEQEFAVFTV